MKIKNYSIKKSLGKGGMGEVFLAYDEICEREVALKQIRADLLQYKTMQSRFLKEARIASQLTHPSIIPIYSIDQEFYTMPYIEGETLKQILRTTREQEKKGEPLHPIGSSIPALIQIFFSICQAIAYTHSKGILHRDLKPENIIVGKYGEVLILDWGLAERLSDPKEPTEVIPGSDISELTRPGKIVGTLTYMAPERARHEPASFQTEIYALGVILYQLLTLRLPFHRHSLAEYRKIMDRETFIDPTERSPYRDIPHALCDIVKKCLARRKEERYRTVEELLADLKNYSEGKPEWIPLASLDLQNKNDWEFQENVLLAKHIAITRTTDVMEWVTLMISKAPFAGNIKLQTTVRLNSDGQGVGFLFNVPEASLRTGVEEGYCLWLGRNECKLFRSNVEVMHIPGPCLPANASVEISIEKIDNHVRFYLNGSLKLHFLSHTPLVGTHVGCLFRDAEFTMRPLHIAVGSQNVMVKCLAVPDAFLASKDFAKAYAEYRRISTSFPGRAEGREAQFRAGVTLLEEGLSHKKKKEREKFFALAQDEFGKLRGTPGAPLEYLGKSLIYKAEDDVEEEVKCLELALRKYPKHPLLPILEEHIAFRLHESSLHHRQGAYLLTLLCLRHLPHLFSNSDHQKLLASLEKHLEPLSFLKNGPVSLQLAFWLNKPFALLEMLSKETAEDLLFCLYKLGHIDLVKEQLPHYPLPAIADLLKGKYQESMDARTVAALFETALLSQNTTALLPHLTGPLRIWALLLENKIDEAGALLKKHSQEELKKESNPLHFLYGCYLRAAEGEKRALEHFATHSHVPHPHSWALLGHYLLGTVDFDELFAWERIQLFRQLMLYYHVAGEPAQLKSFQKKLMAELKNH